MNHLIDNCLLDCGRSIAGGEGITHGPAMLITQQIAQLASSLFRSSGKAGKPGTWVVDAGVTARWTTRRSRCRGDVQMRARTEARAQIALAEQFEVADTCIGPFARCYIVTLKFNRTVKEFPLVRLGLDCG